MAETLSIDQNIPKEEKYIHLLPQIKALLSGEKDEVANMANVAAALKEVFNFWWVGFYSVKEGELVLGPFQGPIACTRIPFNKGVCGACYMQKKTLIVPNVDDFPGHIACSSASKSEIVVPIVRNGNVIAVLDVDSDQLNDFDSTDQLYLEQVADLLK